MQTEKVCSSLQLKRVKNKFTTRTYRLRTNKDEKRRAPLRERRLISRCGNARLSDEHSIVRTHNARRRLHFNAALSPRLRPTMSSFLKTRALQRLFLALFAVAALFTTLLVIKISGGDTLAARFACLAGRDTSPSSPSSLSSSTALVCANDARKSCVPPLKRVDAKFRVCRRCDMKFCIVKKACRLPHASNSLRA